MPKFINLADQLFNLDLVQRVVPWDDGKRCYLHIFPDAEVMIRVPYAEVLLAIAAWEEDAEARQAMVLREALHNSRGRIEVETTELSGY